MSLNKTNMPSTGGKKQDLPEAGSYAARVSRLIDLGLQHRRPYEGKEKTDAYQMSITYELVNEFMKDEDGNDLTDKPRWISEQLNVFKRDQANAKSTDRLNALDPSGEWGDDWGNVPGAACYVTIYHSKDGKYANVASISAPVKGVPVSPLINEPEVFDIDAPDMEMYAKLPEFLQKRMKDMVDFKGSAFEAALSGEPVPTKPAVEEKEGDDDGPPY